MMSILSVKYDRNFKYNIFVTAPVVQWELRQTSLVQRLWSGIAMVRLV